MHKLPFSILILALSSISAFASLDAPGAGSFPLSETDWPWWRGPDRNGHAGEQPAPLEWDETKNIIWKAPIPGRGHGSPSVVSDSIFIATADEQAQTQSVICLDRSTGKRKWMTQVHESGWEGRIHKRNTQASTTVACDGERVFVTFMYDQAIWLTALSLDGSILWQTQASDFVSHWGYSTSPVLYDDLIIVASDHKGGGNLSGFDRKTGAKIWNTERPAIPNYASPVIYRLNGSDQLILPGCEKISSYDPKTGKTIWSTPATTQETVGSAVVDGDRIYASGGYPKNETVCVLADGSGDVLWTSPIRVYAPSMLAHEGYLYTIADTGLAHCWDGQTGDLMWRAKIKGDFSASLTRIGDRLYVSSEQGKTIVFKANPKRFELLAENQLGNETWSSPVITGNRIYLRVAHNDGEQRNEFLYAIGER
jgi:outer membrane protein assembly factor BamB|tara:strand:+ start:2071 stop:3342 length:1272 start_codon:yes stop_codon:yes gene_type:complete